MSDLQELLGKFEQMFAHHSASYADLIKEIHMATKALLQAAADLQAQVTSLKSLDASIVAALTGQAAAQAQAITDAVTKALADAGVSQTDIDSATAAIVSATADVSTTNADLAAAVKAGTPAATVK